MFGPHEAGTATGVCGVCGWLGMIFSLIVGALTTTLGDEPLFVCLIVRRDRRERRVEAEVASAAPAAIAAELAGRQISGR